MDLDYLLLLQNLREATGGFLNIPASEVSNFISSFWIFAIMSFFFWMAKPKDGMRAWFAFSASRCLLNVIKVAACVYRPWVRDENIKPLESVIKGATGYSFPSGHSVTAVACFGYLARWLWNKRRWISVVLIAFAAFVMFARNYVGVHTPQDVFVGAALAIICIFLMPKLFDFVDSLNTKNTVIAYLIGLAVIAGMIVYIMIKPYPTDYVDGKLLVDPAAMRQGCFTTCGEFFGVWTAWFINHHLIHFNIKKRTLSVCLVAFVAIIPLAFWDATFKGIFGVFLPTEAVLFIVQFLKIAYIMILVPICLMRTSEKSIRLNEN